jgi:hypothetical protein
MAEPIQTVPPVHPLVHSPGYFRASFAFIIVGLILISFVVWALIVVSNEIKYIEDDVVPCV